jgi:hypothetical protein
MRPGGCREADSGAQGCPPPAHCAVVVNLAPHRDRPSTSRGAELAVCACSKRRRRVRGRFAIAQIGEGSPHLLCLAATSGTDHNNAISLYSNVVSTSMLGLQSTALV